MYTNMAPLHYLPSLRLRRPRDETRRLGWQLDKALTKEDLIEGGRYRVIGPVLLMWALPLAPRP